MNFYAGLGLVATGGLIAGAIADRMIVRLPVGRSLVWPIREHCEHCFASLPLRWSLPILGIFLCRGRCSNCGDRLRRRSVLIQLLVSCLWVALYLLYFRDGSYPDRAFDIYHPALQWDDARVQALFLYHAILLAFLVVATFIDLDWMIIPDSVTVTGMVVGIALGTFWFAELHPVPAVHYDQFRDFGQISSESMGRWLGASEYGDWADRVRRAWNAHWLDHWNAWNGLLSGTMGLVAGGGIVWAVRVICSWILRTEAIGFGDVTLMAMVGSFLGWQMVLVAFFLAPVSAVVVSLAVWLSTGNRAIPYGPHLSVAAAACIYAWKPIWAYIGEVFQNPGIFLFILMAMLVVLALITAFVQGTKMLFLRIQGRAP